MAPFGEAGSSHTPKGDSDGVHSFLGGDSRRQSTAEFTGRPSTRPATSHDRQRHHETASTGDAISRARATETTKVDEIQVGHNATQESADQEKTAEECAQDCNTHLAHADRVEKMSQQDGNDHRINVEDFAHHSPIEQTPLIRQYEESEDCDSAVDLTPPKHLSTTEISESIQDHMSTKQCWHYLSRFSTPDIVQVLKQISQGLLDRNTEKIEEDVSDETPHGAQIGTLHEVLQIALEHLQQAHGWEQSEDVTTVFPGKDQRKAARSSQS